MESVIEWLYLKINEEKHLAENKNDVISLKKYNELSEKLEPQLKKEFQMFVDEEMQTLAQDTKIAFANGFKTAMKLMCEII